jgi:hypothetical protein
VSLTYKNENQSEAAKVSEKKPLAGPYPRGMTWLKKRSITTKVNREHSEKSDSEHVNSHPDAGNRSDPP